MASERPSGRSAPGRFPRPTLLEWLCLAGGLFLILQYAWYLDDAFVYFRYADNALFLGHGLVFNAGEYVEGYSSPLWMLLVLLLWATGLTYWVLVRGVAVVTFALFWAGLVRLNRRLSPSGVPVVNLPLCYLAFSYPVLSYFTSGMETPLVQVSAVLYALFLLDPGSRALQAALALTPLLRPELAAPLAAGWLFLWVRNRRFPFFLSLAAAAANAFWLLFRIFYYADLLPNTFYLKNATHFSQGWTYLKDAFLPYWFPAYLAVALLLLLLARRKPGDLRFPGRWADLGPRLAMLVLAAVVAIYVVKIGGDARHYRYLAFPFCLAACAGAGAPERSLRAFAPRRAAIWAWGCATALVLASASFYPAQLSAHPLTRIHLYRKVDQINDADYHRHHPDLARPAWEWPGEVDQRWRYAGFLQEGGRYAGVFVGGWCADLYRAFDRYAVHSLGLTDPILARTQVPTRRPGHKMRLMPLAKELGRLYRAHGGAAPGILRRAAESGNAPAWVAANIEVIERKARNRHRLGENLRLALTFPGPIEPFPRGTPVRPRRAP